MKKIRQMAAASLSMLVALGISHVPAAASGDEVVLRVCNWEEYIDEGGWDDDEVIDLDSGDIIGENDMISDFEEWYEETYGKKVKVEYSTFGTNEDLYNMLTLGDVYDLVCPSEYMIMKLMSEDKLTPLSDEFFDTEDENNYYSAGVSPYIRRIFEENEIGGKKWSEYAAGYMWGVTGFVYNPEEVSYEEASTWHLLENKRLARRITVKDNVRDTFFAAVGAVKSELLTSDAFRDDPDYPEKLKAEMNDTSPEMIEKVQEYLQSNKDNFYSFETDAGKADMITGKVVANLQWSGDAVYTLDQADEDDYYLEWAVPEESTNVYFDGWCMLKAGVGGDAAKQHAAEAFINFVSRPDNAIRNMYYIGYTSVIANEEDGRMGEYLRWCYEPEEEEEETAEPDDEEFSEDEPDGEAEDADEAEVEEEMTEYSVAMFFTGEEDDEDGDYTLLVPESSLRRQLAAQYPSAEVLERASIMECFDDEVSERANQMWINIRCFNIKRVSPFVWAALAFLVLAGCSVWVIK